MSNARGSGGSQAMRKLAQQLSGQDVPCSNRTAGPNTGTKAGLHFRCLSCGGSTTLTGKGRLRPHTVPNNVVG